MTAADGERDALGETFEAACPGCYSQGSALHRSLALLRYEAGARRWIRGFKSGRSPFGPPLPARLATEFFADELALACCAESPGDVIVPVPLHPRRERRRGFNQSALIAGRIARKIGVHYEPGGLLRRRATRTQAHLRGDARRGNLRHAFAVAPGSRLAQRVWLVDDVLTTGATLESAAECLLAAGVDEVRALTLAATVPFRTRRMPRPRGSFPPEGRRLARARMLPTS